MGGWVFPLTLEEQEDVMHVMALEQYEKFLAVRIEAARIKFNAPWSSPTNAISYLADLAKANLDVANTYHKIAGVYKTQDKYEMAVYHFKKCLAIQIEHLGANNLDVANTYYKIGLVYHTQPTWSQPKYQMALWHFEKCLEIRKVLGADVANFYMIIDDIYERWSEQRESVLASPWGAATLIRSDRAEGRALDRWTQQFGDLS